MKEQQHSPPSNYTRAILITEPDPGPSSTKAPPPPRATRVIEEFVAELSKSES